MRCLSSTPPLVLAPDGAVCGPADLVVFTFDEAAAYSANPFALTLADASLLATSILLLWATAFAFRMIFRALGAADDALKPED